ncbi:AAA family ATPase [Polynucleobacter sp. AP-Capit-er-40B-B4]|uniref:AAA family ATPase n=1 Tax=Polynucleobacter sp. AP-Capit-er-40B-B4 TaxID=2576927 RepID=UPI001C0E144D|nr:AAA family ATPase [Polynucleobacter sp. AP-Capit-er-40B-B4]MBU3580440.1 AAA family ATPase [Polynucleobacter sp. AP-Capit-er-40B-B4]
MSACQLCGYENRSGVIYCRKCKSAIAEPAITRKTLALHLADEITELYKQHQKVSGKPGLYLIESRFPNFDREFSDALSELLNFSCRLLESKVSQDKYQGYIFSELSEKNEFDNKTSPDFGQIISLITQGKDVFIVQNNLESINKYYRDTAISVITIPRFTEESLEKACKIFYNHHIKDEQDLSWSRFLVPEDFLINAKVKDSPLPHILDSLEHRLAQYQCKDARNLEELYAFGEARDWAYDWSKDAREILAGSKTLKWGDLERGILLVGKHGMGKLDFAKSLAKASGVHLLECSIEDLTASDIKDYFMAQLKEAKALSPCILYVHTGTSALDLTPFLFDSFNEDEPVFILLARNKRVIPDNLLRAKRIERVFQIPYPTARILKDVYQPLLKAVDCELSQLEMDQLANSSQGYVGSLARAEQIVRSAKRQARRKNLPISLADLIDQIYEVPSKSVRTLPLDKIRDTAFHEAGHAAMMLLTNRGLKNITYLSVVPKDDYLGFTSYAFDEDDPDETRNNLLETIRVKLGGRAAEEIHMGIDGISTGPSSDLESATRVASYMLTSFGFGINDSLVSWEPDLSRNDELRNQIDDVLKAEYKATVDTLKKNWKLVENLVEAVMKSEEITGNEMRQIYQAYLSTLPQLENPKE